MELCLITPAYHLDCAELLSGRFCLANVAVKDKVYLEFFKQASESGYEVVLDNGAFEGDLLEDAQFVEVAEEIKPKALVVPDLLNADSRRNYNYALGFITGYQDDNHTPFELMFVPQCTRSDTGGYLRSITDAIDSGFFRWIGVCRNACYNAFGKYTKTDNESINKLFFGAWAEYMGILRHAREKKIFFHLLGIGNDFRMLQFLWWVERADTASLFFQGVLGNRVSKCGLLSGKVSRPHDFFLRNFSLNALQKSHITFNCQKASEYATAAARLRGQIYKERI